MSESSPMKHMDLFSGIPVGGFALAARWVGWETIGFCEIDPYCQKVLRKHWPDVPIYDDIRELSGEEVGPVDIISGGYPCQPFSVAGERRGEKDDRHLWPEFARIIREAKPTYVVCENVAGHISMGLDDVLSDLEGLGYTWEAFVIPACAVNAKHRRDRVWIIGNANNAGKSIGPIDAKAQVMQDVAHPNGTQRERGGISGGIREEYTNPGSGSRWEAEPGVGRVANGIPSRVDRLKGLGNSVVPAIPEILGRAIMEQA